MNQILPINQQSKPNFWDFRTKKNYENKSEKIRDFIFGIISALIFNIVLLVAIIFFEIPMPAERFLNPLILLPAIILIGVLVPIMRVFDFFYPRTELITNGSNKITEMNDYSLVAHTDIIAIIVINLLIIFILFILRKRKFVFFGFLLYLIIPIFLVLAIAIALII